MARVRGADVQQIPVGFGFGLERDIREDHCQGLQVVVEVDSPVRRDRAPGRWLTVPVAMPHDVLTVEVIQPVDPRICGEQLNEKPHP